MAFAVITAGGRQVRVEPGELVRVDRLAGEPGDEVRFDRVMLVGDDGGVRVGTPFLDGAVVRGRVVEQRRDRKVIVFRKIKTKQFRKTRGHREYYSLVRIEEIS
ncbi:MAG: 50S ribosomal protein L21 [Acidobacteria bacterium]|nr:50S ribosomal protein L21 [Acidobacteriota bacterium]